MVSVIRWSDRILCRHEEIGRRRREIAPWWPPGLMLRCFRRHRDYWDHRHDQPPTALLACCAAHNAAPPPAAPRAAAAVFQIHPSIPFHVPDLPFHSIRAEVRRSIPFHSFPAGYARKLIVGGAVRKLVGSMNARPRHALRPAQVGLTTRRRPSVVGPALTGVRRRLESLASIPQAAGPLDATAHHEDGFPRPRPHPW